jgi:DNA-binding NarL/FixJ family response regulator
VTGQRILVVDDHAGFRATARRWLEAEGWTVVGEASDGATAIRAAGTLRPDVVLLDIGLPDMDGFVVAEMMARDGAPDVVLVSSRDPGTYAGRLATSAAIGFIAKADLDGDGLRAVLASKGQ